MSSLDEKNIMEFVLVYIGFDIFVSKSLILFYYLFLVSLIYQFIFRVTESTKLGYFSSSNKQIIIFLEKSIGIFTVKRTNFPRCFTYKRKKNIIILYFP